MNKENQHRRKQATIIGLLSCIILIFVSIPTLTDAYEENKIQQTKHVSTESMTLTKDAIYKLERRQREHANQYEESQTWLYDEMNSGARHILFGYDFMEDHPKYDQVRITYSQTTYVIDGKKITFISDEGTIRQAHTSTGWETIRIQ